MRSDDIDGESFGETTMSATGVHPARGRDRAVPTRIGRYTVLKPLGAGGMGVVYAAYDMDLDRKVAIKLLHGDVAAAGPDTIGHSRLLREAQAMAKISHPNVLQVFEAGTHEGQVFLALELVEGSTLEDWLTAEPRDWRSVLAMFLQAGRGLQAAHDVGLIHRDFKPENVLVDQSGRARVMDFGLARVAGTIEPVLTDSAEHRSSQLLQRLTVTGSVMGTPLYMAPEQHLGGATDPRTDEFAFCVALFEALHGQRPFAGDDLKSLAFNVVRGVVREPPRDRRIPAWLRRGVLRGLSASADDRFPTMAALLAALGRDPGAARRRGLLLAGAAALLVAGAWGFATVQAARDQRCRGAELLLVDTWGPAQAKALAAAFAATGRPYAAATAQRVQAQLDARAAAWAGLHTSACEAHARGEISAELLDLQGACLERRRSETAALAELLARADGEIVDKGVSAALSLPPIAACADRSALLARVKPPEDPAVASEVLRLRGLLDQAKAAQDAGKFKDGLAIVGPVVEAADMTGHRPVIAEAQQRLGELHSRASDLTAAEPALWAALWAAEAGHHDEVAAATWTELVRVVVKLGRLPEVPRYAERAGAAVARLGDDPVAEARLENEIGTLAYVEQKHEDAAVHYRRALELRRAALGEAHPDVAATLANLGNAQHGLDRFDEALATYNESLALRETTLGPDHPDVAVTLNNIGVLFKTRGKNDEALAALLRAQDIWTRALGPDNPILFNAAMNIANVYHAQNQLDRAQAVLEEVVARTERVLPPDHPIRITAMNNLAAQYLMRDDFVRGEPLLRASLAAKERVYGPDHPDVAEALDNLGSLAGRLEHLDEAAELFTRALAIREPRLGLEHSDLVAPLSNLAQIELERGDLVRAEALARRALAIAEKAFGPEGYYCASPLFALATVELEHRRPAAALTLLARVASILARETPLPEQQARLDFTRARALRDSGGDPTEARALAEKARAYFIATHQPNRLATVDAWLARRR
jgi:serine/threonine protein kinase/Tfp pilus assembly protein PilF